MTATLGRPRTASTLLAVQGLLIFVPLAVLGAAIGWPASLDDPAAVALPRLLENEGAVRLGYLVYLAYSVLFLPVAIWTTRAVARADDPLVRLAIGFAVASTLARTIGILRWLTAMPELARTWVAAPPEAHPALAAVYDALNSFGGGIGEILGVSLFAAGWLACTVAAARRAAVAPSWLVLAGGVVAAVLTAPLVALLGVDPGPLTTVASIAVQLWFLAAAVALFRTR